MQSWTPTSNSLNQPLVRCGPNLSHILTSALVPSRTGHTHIMLPKLSTVTVTYHTQPAYLQLTATMLCGCPCQSYTAKTGYRWWKRADFLQSARCNPLVSGTSAHALNHG